MKRLASRFDVVAYATPQEHLAVNAAERRGQPWTILVSTRTRGKVRSQRRGPITKAGHSRVRWLLIQAVVSILRRRPRATEGLWTRALRIAARRGKHVAIVALARRLAGILNALLRDRTVYTLRRPTALPNPIAALHA